MGDDICAGNKEIIAFLREIKLLSQHTTYRSARETLRRWKKRYGLVHLIHYFPNGRPFILKSEILLWAARTDELFREQQVPVLQRWRIDRNK